MKDEEAEMNLAWRLDPGTDRQHVMEQAGLLVAGSLVAAFSVAFFPVSPRHGVVFIVAGVALASLAFVPRDVPKELEPLAEGAEGYGDAVSAIGSSQNKRERAQIFLGTIWGTGRCVPFLIADAILKLNILILGSTGAMKTWRALMMILHQSLSRGNRSLVFFDHSGDPALAPALREMAKKFGMDFAYFSSDPNRASHLWPMLADPAFADNTPNVKAQIVASAGGMDGNDTQNSGYFAACTERAMRGGFKLAAGIKMILNYRVLCQILAAPGLHTRLGMSKKDFDNGTHGTNLFDRMAEDPRINTRGREGLPESLYRHAISFDRPIRKPTIMLFHVPMFHEPATSRFQTRFAIRTFCDRVSSWEGPRVEHIHICVDEFGEIAHGSLETPLRQIRKFGASLIFVFQNLSDLKKNGHDFVDTVTNNTALKISMTAKDLMGRDYFERTGGEVLRDTVTTSETETTTPLGKTVSIGKQVRQDWVPRFDSNTLAEVNSNPDLAIIETPRSEFAQWPHPVIVEMSMPYTIEEFEQFKSIGWPKSDGVRSILASDLEDDDGPEPEAEPAPTPDEPPAAPPGNGKKKTAPVDPERLARAEEAAKQLRNANQ